MTDLTTVVGEAASVIDPQGENEDISMMCALIVWAVDHPDDYTGWDLETLSLAFLWNFNAAPEEAGEMARQLVAGAADARDG